MNDNYIEFVMEEKKLIAHIYDFDNNKKQTIMNKQSLKELISICKYYGYNITGPCIIDDDLEKTNAIIDEFNDYLIQKKNNIKLFKNPPEKAKLAKKAPIKHAKIMISTLVASAIAISGITAKHKKNEETTLPDTSITQSTDSKENNSSTSDTYTINTIIDEPKQFHYSYQNRSSDYPINNAREYEAIFERYAHRYGLDKNLLMAIAAQESNGDHYGTLDTGYGVGIMQIEEAVHLGAVESAFNFETGTYDTIEVTEDTLRNLETNIQLGAMILRQCIDNSCGNIPLALQTYNFGYGNMESVLDECYYKEGLDKETIKNDPTNNSWLKYRDILSIGDPEYVEHVFSYLPDGTDITIKDNDYNDITIRLINDKEKVHTK